MCSISQQLYKSLLCFVFFSPLLLPQELAGLFPFFATNISNSTCETTRGRQKSHGLSYHHLHPSRNLSSCQFCTCWRSVFHSYYKVVSLLGRRGKVKKSVLTCKASSITDTYQYSSFSCFPVSPPFSIQLDSGGLDMVFKHLKVCHGRQITLVLPGPRR